MTNHLEKNNPLKICSMYLDGLVDALRTLSIELIHKVFEEHDQYKAVDIIY